MKGVKIMLWIDLIDIGFFIVGGLFGAIVISLLTVSKCDECREEMRRCINE